MNKRVMLAILCAKGGTMVGYFANQLTETYGIMLFSFGIGMMVTSIFKLSKL